MSFPEALLDQVWNALTLGAAAAWLVITPLTRGLAPAARGRLRAPTALLLLHAITLVVAAGSIAGGYDPIVAQVSGLAFVLLAVIGLAQVLVFSIGLPRVGVVVPRIVIDVLTAIAALVALIAVGKRAGFSVAGLITTSAVLTAVIGFSLQDTLGNLMGGLALQMDSSIKVGDWIQVANQPAGRVNEIRWRYTAIETRNWETIIVPNSMLMKGQVMVLGRRTGQPLMHRRRIEFRVDFRTPPTQVIEAVLRELTADPIPAVASQPVPQVLFWGIEDSYAVYAARYWLTDMFRDDPTDSEIRIRIYFALRRAGIPMSIPAQSVFVTADTDERRDRKVRDEHGRRLAALAGVDLLEALDADERDRVAAQLVEAPFARGEAVTHEGEREDGLYIIVTGRAAVRIGRGDAARDVAQLGPGQFFGEMSLMTGAARAATVVAVTDLLCFRIDKPAFEELIRRRPELAEAVAEILAARRGALAEARDQVDEDRREHLATTKQDLLGRIRSFFSLGGG